MKRASGPRTSSAPRRSRFRFAKTTAHDVHAMAQADPDAGLIYVCNPNNPTGSITSKEDIEYLVAHKPKDAIVLLDEAYIHLSKNAEPASALVAAGKDVIILRTFSKLYGMAGLRAGAALGRPDLLAKLRNYGAGALPVTGMVGAIASLKVKGLVKQRRDVIADIREQTAGWLVKKGYRGVAVGSQHADGRRQAARPPGFPGPAQGKGRHRPHLAVDAAARPGHDRHQ